MICRSSMSNATTVPLVLSKRSRSATGWRTGADPVVHPPHQPRPQRIGHRVDVVADHPDSRRRRWQYTAGRALDTAVRPRRRSSATRQPIRSAPRRSDSDSASLRGEGDDLPRHGRRPARARCGPLVSMIRSPTSMSSAEFVRRRMMLRRSNTSWQPSTVSRVVR